MSGIILLVEDDKLDVFLMQRALKRAGVLHPLHIASDGQQAIDFLQGAGKFADRCEFPLPTLVLLDLNLPLVRGLDVLKWIGVHCGVPPIVVILSSSDEPQDVAAAYSLGANAYLVKPLELTKLEEMVRAINQFWLQSNTAPAEAQTPLQLRILAASLPAAAA